MTAPDATAQRLRGLRIHFLAFGAVALLLTVVNLVAFPDRLWFPLFLVGWGAPLAIHVAYVMGLFGAAERKG